MGKIADLPFKTGQMAEAKSFLIGYRSAWFRCKIKEIKERKGEIWHSMEYIDFPGEKIKWTKLYQVSKGGISREKKRDLMVRPQYPRFYQKKDLPHKITEVTVTTDGVFEIGDLVDWWKDYCYWCATVTKILSKDMVQIELPQPPLGEGVTYEADSKDLRPSLDWSPKNGWKVLSSKGSKTGHTCGSIIQPGDPAIEDLVDSVSKDSKDFDDTAGCSFPPSLSSHVSSKIPKSKEKSKQNTAISTEVAPPPEPIIDLHMAKHATEKAIMVDSVSSSYVTPETVLNTVGEGSSGSLKRLREDKDLIPVIPVNSTRSDSIEAAIFDLEELVNKVKWVKNILEFGIPLPARVKPEWKFVEHRPSSTSKQQFVNNS
jgi:hypothetical protein